MATQAAGDGRREALPPTLDQEIGAAVRHGRRGSRAEVSIWLARGNGGAEAAGKRTKRSMKRHRPRADERRSRRMWRVCAALWCVR